MAAVSVFIRSWLERETVHALITLSYEGLKCPPDYKVPHYIITMVRLFRCPSCRLLVVQTTYCVMDAFTVASLLRGNRKM